MITQQITNVSNFGEFSIGMYDPVHEKDSCGVGLVVDTSGRASHRTVQDALDVLVSLEHRSAVCEDTGDGAGLMLALPHEFFVLQATAAGVELPAPGAYGVAQVNKNTT